MLSRGHLILPLAIAASAAASCGPEAGAVLGGSAAAGSGDAASTTIQASVDAASPPSDPCGWIPAAEVEEAVGYSLAAAPVAEGAVCRYPLPPDLEIEARRESGREILRELEALGAESFGEAGLDEAAVTLEVDLSGGIPHEVVLDAAAHHFDDLLGAATAVTDPGPARPAGPDDWDYESAPMGQVGFVGRLGHVRITVTVGNGVNLPSEAPRTLAARVRDRIPDRPIAAARQTAHRTSDPDPCSLLTPAEAESVLGPLLVEPYRSAEESPLADAAGRSCTYFTAGHRALVITPEWSYGKSTLETVRGMSDLIGAAVVSPVAEAADTLEGPWDDAAGDAASGGLLFLKGDRLIRIDYATSSTDAAGAVRLARLAVARL